MVTHTPHAPAVSLLWPLSSPWDLGLAEEGLPLTSCTRAAGRVVRGRDGQPWPCSLILGRVCEGLGLCTVEMLSLWSQSEGIKQRDKNEEEGLSTGRDVRSRPGTGSDTRKGSGGLGLPEGCTGARDKPTQPPRALSIPTVRGPGPTGSRTSSPQSPRCRRRRCPQLSSWRR